MAKVSFAKLKIEPTAAANIYKVTVRYRIAFKQADYGQRFNYTISLRPADVAVGEHAQPDLPTILYRFKFGKTFVKRVTGGPFTTVAPTTVTRLVLAKDLNEDPGTKPIDPNGGSGPAKDEIYGLLTLTKGTGQIVQFIDARSTNIQTVPINDSQV